MSTKKTLYILNSRDATNSSTGCFILNGGIGIRNSSDAISVGSLSQD